MFGDPIADGERVDPFLGARARYRNVDRADKRGHGAIVCNGDNRQSAANARINTEHLDHISFPGQFPWR
jgi:hypothetical protein